MFGRLVLEAGARQRLLVPERALLKVGQLSFVVLADAERTRRLVVPGGRAAGERIEVLSGLSAGEEVVVPGE